MRDSVLAALLFFAAACTPASTLPVVVNDHVTVTVFNIRADGPSAPIVHPDDPRIAASGRAIAELLGHPVRYEVDAALAAKFGAGLHEEFVAAMEATVDGLKVSQKRSPDAFTFASPLLRTIALAYTPAAEGLPPALDPRTGVLRVVSPPREESLLTPGVVEDAIVDAFRAAVAKRYADKAPESIPSSEQRAYFGYLSEREPSTPYDQRAEDASLLKRTALLIRLFDAVTDETLRADLRKALVDHGERLVYVAKRGGEKLPAAWGAVQSAFVRWVNARGPDEWTPRERRTLVDLMLPRDAAANEPLRRGFDALRFGRPVVQAFARSGAGGRASAGDDEYVERAVVCPYFRGGSSLIRPGGCSPVFYVEVLASPNGARRLADLVSEVKSDAFTESAVLNVLDGKGTAASLDFIEGLGSGGGAQEAALRALAEFRGWKRNYTPPDGQPAPDGNLVVARVLRWWTSRPKLRGALLYVLTEVGGAQEGTVVWSHLAQTLGGPVTADEYGSFLDQDSRTLWSVTTVEHGLGRWPRAPVVLPRFQRWLDDFASNSGNGLPDRSAIAQRVVESFCENGIADVTALQAFLRTRFDAHPSEKSDLGPVVESRPADLCAADSPAARAARATGANHAQPILFGN